MYVHCAVYFVIPNSNSQLPIFCQQIDVNHFTIYVNLSGILNPI